MLEGIATKTRNCTRGQWNLNVQKYTCHMVNKIIHSLDQQLEVENYTQNFKWKLQKKVFQVSSLHSLHTLCKTFFLSII